MGFWISRTQWVIQVSRTQWVIYISRTQMRHVNTTNSTSHLHHKFNRAKPNKSSQYHELRCVIESSRTQWVIYITNSAGHLNITNPMGHLHHTTNPTSHLHHNSTGHLPTNSWWSCPESSRISRTQMRHLYTTNSMSLVNVTSWTGHPNTGWQRPIQCLIFTFSAKEPYNWWLFCGKRPVC